MQPYFFPYIGYFQLINAVDEFIFFDEVQFNKKSWMGRNRILNENLKKEFKYFGVCLNNYQKGILIKDLKLDNNEEWKKKTLSKLNIYKKIQAPFYKKIINIIEEILSLKSDSFLDLVITIIEKIFLFLELEFKYELSSNIEYERSLIKAPDEWALYITKKRSASCYINASNGQNFFNTSKYKKENIELKFLNTNKIKYHQKNNQFIPNLSIIDVLMFNSKETVKKMLEEYTLI